MVSAEKYLRTFVRVMPQRFKLYYQIKQQKDTIDLRILSENKIPIKAIPQLLNLIGADGFIKTAEKSKRMSLRRAAWKILKASQFMQGFIESGWSEPH